MSRSLPTRLGLVCGLAAFTMLGGAAVAQEGVAVKNLLGNIGLIPKEKDPIRYRERAPLVVPPKAELRPPMAESFASTNPQWPNDPDVSARRSRAAEERRPVTWSETRRMSENNPRLTLEELRRGRSARGSDPNPAPHRGDNDRASILMTPDQLRAGRPGAARDAEQAAAGETQRRVLTDPPSAMRRSATGGKVNPDFEPRVDQQTLDANPMTWLTRKFRSEDEDE